MRPGQKVFCVSRFNPGIIISYSMDSGKKQKISMDLNVIQNGTINDPEDILKANGLESGSGKPIISINSAKEINIYSK